MPLKRERKPIAELSESEIDDILQLLKPYYTDPKPLLQRELDHNNTIYQLKDANDQLLSFFMVAYEQHTWSAGNRIVYLGLSCANADSKEKRLATRVYYYFIADASNYEQSHGKKLILYCTTASPIVLSILPKLFDSVIPDQEGNFAEEDRELVSYIKTQRGLNRYQANYHPYVLKGIAKDTRYSIAEHRRLKAYERECKIDLFRTLNVDETKGDRLLLTFSVPTGDKLESLKAKLF